MSLGFSDEDNVPGIGAITGADISKDEDADNLLPKKTVHIDANMIVKDISGLAHTRSDQFVKFESSDNLNHISKFCAPTVNYSLSNNETITHLELDIEGFVDQVRVQKAIDYLNGKCDLEDSGNATIDLEGVGVFWTTDIDFLSNYSSKAKLNDICITIGDETTSKFAFQFDGKDWVKLKYEQPNYSYIEECIHEESETCLIVDKYLTHITYLEEILDENGIEF